MRFRLSENCPFRKRLNNLVNVSMTHMLDVPGWSRPTEPIFNQFQLQWQLTFIGIQSAPIIVVNVIRSVQVIQVQNITLL